MKTMRQTDDGFQPRGIIFFIWFLLGMPSPEAGNREIGGGGGFAVVGWTLECFFLFLPSLEWKCRGKQNWNSFGGGVCAVRL